MGAARRLIVPLAAGIAALAIAGCGEDDFKNNPRPPAPIELGALINNGGVRVSPTKDLGAGPATITISNQTDQPARVVFEGPTNDSSDPIIAGGTGSMKLDLAEGEYTVSTGEGGGRAQQLDVGPERPSSQNDLLLP
jgi:hypothetical protein